jgi:Spx/MgsR family transcriptional regulator
MSTKVYGIPNCNTVKKAIDWLKENNIAFAFHDYKKKGITNDKLEEWSKHFGWEEVLNKKGTTWQKLTDEEKAAVKDEKTAIAFMAEKTSAIKRPIIEANGQYLIRFDEEKYKQALLKS